MKSNPAEKARMLGARFEGMLGIEVLSKEYIRFCNMHIVFLFFFNMNNIFVSTFLYKATGNFATVMYYNIYLYVFQAFATMIGVVLIQKTSVVASTRMGIVFHALVYLSFIIFGAGMSNFYPLIALVFALGGGFYWLTESIYITSFTSDRHRDVAVGYTNLWSSIASIVVPTFAGMLVSLFEGFTGYRVLFGIGFVLAVISGYLSGKLSQPKLGEAKKPRFMEALREVFTIKAEAAVAAASMFRGCRDGVFSFVLSIMLLEILNNEAYVGLNSFVAGVAALASAWPYGKLVRPGNRGQWMTVSTTIMMIVTVLVFFKVNAFTIIMLSLFTNLCANFMINPVFMYGYVVIQAVPQANEKRLESQTMLQMALYFGRAIGIVATLAMINAGLGYIIPLAILTAIQYLTIWMTRLAKREVEAIEAAKPENEQISNA